MNNKKSASPLEENSIDDEELPEGWRRTKLSDTVEIIMGQSPPGDSYNQIGEGIPLINGPVEFGPSPFSETIKSKFTIKPTKMCKTNDLLLCVRGSTTGRINIAGFDACVGRGVAALRSKENQKYLNLFIHSKEKYIYSLGTGSTFPNIQSNTIANLDFPLPPLPEQQRIVARVEALLMHVNATRDRLSRVLLIMKRFRQAVLAAACSGRLTEGWREKNPDVEPANALISKILDERQLWYDSEFNKAKLDGRKKPKKPKLLRYESSSEELTLDLPVSWDICFFEDIAASFENAIKAGPFGSSLTKSCYTKSGYKIYGQEQVIKGDPTYGDYWIPEEKYRELESCKVRPSDILISLVGTVGKVLVLPDDCKAGIINPRLVKLSLNQKISKQYVKFYLESPLAKNRLFGDSHGGTMEILNLEILKKLPIPLPPLAEQHEIVRRVDALFERADAIEREVVAATKRTEALTQAVLGKAFRGELVEREGKFNSGVKA